MEHLFMIIGGVLFGFGYYLKYEKSLNNPSLIKPRVAKKLISLGAKTLDVRTPGEYNLGHANNAINMTYNEINDINLLKNNINKNDMIVVYCNSGTRARKAADKLISLGYTEVFYIVETYISLIN